MERRSSGTGIESISHFFLSPIQSGEPKSSSSQKNPVFLPSQTGHRVLALSGQTPGLPSIYWSAHLATALVACGKKVLLLDVGTAPDQLAAVLDSVSVYPSLDAFLKQPVKTLTLETPGGFRALSFQICIDELERFKLAEREMLFGILHCEEQAADVLLINIQFDAMAESWIRYLHVLQEAVLVISREDTLGAYRILKLLYSIHPGLRLGLMEYSHCLSPAERAAETLGRAAQTFLKKTPLNLGHIPLEVVSDKALFLKNQPNAAMIEIAQKIIQGLNRRAGQKSFFEQLQRPTRQRSERQ